MEEQADKLLDELPSLKKRMINADKRLYEDCIQSKTNLIEEFTMEYFHEYMDEVTLPINGGAEKMSVPRTGSKRMIPEEVKINNEIFTKEEIESLIQVSQWRYTRT